MFWWVLKNIVACHFTKILQTPFCNITYAMTFFSFFLQLEWTWPRSETFTMFHQYYLYAVHVHRRYVGRVTRPTWSLTRLSRSCSRWRVREARHCVRSSQTETEKAQRTQRRGQSGEALKTREQLVGTLIQWRGSQRLRRQHEWPLPWSVSQVHTL